MRVRQACSRWCKIIECKVKCASTKIDTTFDLPNSQTGFKRVAEPRKQHQRCQARWKKTKIEICFPPSVTAMMLLPLLPLLPEQHTHLSGTSSPLHGVAATIQLLVSRLASPHCPSLLFTKTNFSPREHSDKSIPQSLGGAISWVPSL